MIIRLKLEESDAMKTVLKRKKTVALPIGEVLRKHWVLVLLGAGALPLAQVTYFKNTFALSWATSELGYDRGTFLGAIAIALVVQFIVQPFGAVLVSRIDMRKAMCIMVIPEFVLMPAMFFAIRTENFAIAVVVMCLATIPHSMFYGAIAGVLARAFPRQHPLHRSFRGLPAVFAGRRRRHPGAGAVDAQLVRKHRRRCIRVGRLCRRLPGLHPVVAEPDRIRRAPVVDRGAIRRGRTAARHR